MFQIVIKKVKNTMLWTYVISDFKGEEIVGRFYEKKLKKKKKKQKKKKQKQKQIRNSLELKK